MVCIYCGGSTQVVNSRAQKRLGSVWRRRKCLVCKSIWSTAETADLASSIMVTQALPAESRVILEPFQRDKLLLSVYDSCRHRETAHTDATELTRTIIGRLLKEMPGARMKKSDIQTVTQDVLSKFDNAANVHYAAYHPSKQVDSSK